MSVATTFTAQGAVSGGTPITVEADISRGLHAFSIVGLPGKAIEEAKDRINAAIKNSGYPAPKSQNQKIVISLSPADIKKEGPLFDVPMALAYLQATETIDIATDKRMFVGELSLDGSLRPVYGVLPITQIAKQHQYTEIFVPKANAAEAALVDGITVYGVDTLNEIIAHCKTDTDTAIPLPASPVSTLDYSWDEASVRLEDIKGQEQAKRALLIAAAGAHNVLLVGPPGTGKTMLARALQSLLPPLSREEALTVTAIHSLAGAAQPTLSAQPPFRAPHHTASHTALVGGGSNPKPGEVTLAHHGVLFTDELPEFERRSIDALRQPLEDRVVTISRVQGTTSFPADFILVAAMNPYRGSEDGSNDYAAAMTETYKNKISGPILDRIDLWVPMPHIDYDTLHSNDSSFPTTRDAREQIQQARNSMQKRLKDRAGSTNSSLSARDIKELITLDEEVNRVLKDAGTKLNLSPRSYHRIIKVARTIADLDGADEITSTHILEALQYRAKL